MRELAPGLWHWESVHPETDGTEWWPTVVSSFAVDDDHRLFVVDPVDPPGELGELAAGRDAAVVLTNPWHDRDARVLVERFGMDVWLPAPDDGTGDADWLLRDCARSAHLYTLDAGLPSGITAFPGHKWNDMVIWFESHRVAASGDTLVDFGEGLEIHPKWLPAGVTREQVAGPLRELLQLDLRYILATHGGAHTRADLEGALAHDPSV